MTLAEALGEGNTEKGRQAEDSAHPGAEFSWSSGSNVLIQLFLQFPVIKLENDVKLPAEIKFISVDVEIDLFCMESLLCGLGLSVSSPGSLLGIPCPGRQTVSVAE